MKLTTFPNTNALIDHAIEQLSQWAASATPSDTPHCGIMLSGGRTPLKLYHRMAQEMPPLPATLFLSDERYVPSSDPMSNYGQISPHLPTLLEVDTTQSIEQAADLFGDAISGIQSIPLGFLGLGTDGHTASLFNLDDAALRDDRLAIPVEKDEKPDRISVTPMLLNRIDRIIILATGAEKIEMIQTALNNPTSIPCGVALADHPNVEIWTDQELG